MRVDVSEMQEPLETPVQLFFTNGGNSTTSDTKDNSDASVQYIIMQNDVLHHKYDTITSELNELKVQNDELEIDNERLQKSRLCLQGYTKNEYIRATEYKKLNKIYKNGNKSLTIYFYACNMMSVAYIIIPFQPIPFHVLPFISATILAIHLFILYKCHKNLKKIFDKSSLNKSQREIQTIEKSTKLIEDIVDNM